ncbi:TlpA family protein disulfide reductase, partial [Butyricimonas paravirosa]
FTCLGIEGKETSLTDLAGKYVYIDIWATWCRPCRAEQPYLEQLIRKYEGENIVFVSISTDRDWKVWERFVKTEQLKGLQLYGGKGNSFIEAFVVRSIPRFILLDREGKIVEADMTRPSNPRTIKVLDSLLSS